MYLWDVSCFHPTTILIIKYLVPASRLGYYQSTMFDINDV